MQPRSRNIGRFAQFVSESIRVLLLPFIMHRRTFGYPISNFPVKGIQSSFVNLLSTLTMNDYKDHDLRANYVLSMRSLGSAVSAKTVKAGTRITRDSVITRIMKSKESFAFRLSRLSLFRCRRPQVPIFIWTRCRKFSFLREFRRDTSFVKLNRNERSCKVRYRHTVAVLRCSFRAVLSSRTVALSESHRRLDISSRVYLAWISLDSHPWNLTDVRENRVYRQQLARVRHILTRNARATVHSSCRSNYGRTAWSEISLDSRFFFGLTDPLDSISTEFRIARHLFRVVGSRRNVTAFGYLSELFARRYSSGDRANRKYKDLMFLFARG